MTGTAAKKNMQGSEEHLTTTQEYKNYAEVRKSHVFHLLETKAKAQHVSRTSRFRPFEAQSTKSYLSANKRNAAHNELSST